MPRSPRLALPALSLALLAAAGPACGPPADAAELTRDGYASLGRSDWETALEDFDAALAALGGDTAHRTYKPAAVGRLKALARLEPPAAARECLALADRGTATAEDVAKLGAFLLEGGARNEAAHLMHGGLERFENSEELALLEERVLASAEKDPEVAKLLEGLGYLGD